MQRFKAALERFAEQGEKTGWTYFTIPAAIAEQLKPGIKKSFRVKGKIDDYSFKNVALLPMGGGDFIMPLKGEVRKAIGKTKGATVQVSMAADDTPFKMNSDLLDCLADEPVAQATFNSYPGSVQRYYSNWIDSAKTDETKAKRIAKAVNSLARGLNYGEMIREK